MTPQLESLLELVSPRVGLMKSLNLRVKSADEPDLPFIYDGLLSHFDFRRGDKTERGSCGKGGTEDEGEDGGVGRGSLPVTKKMALCHLFRCLVGRKDSLVIESE